MTPAEKAAVHQATTGVLWVNPHRARVAEWSNRRLLKENFAKRPVFRSESTEEQRQLRQAIGAEVMKRWQRDPEYRELHEAREQYFRSRPLPEWGSRDD